MDEHGQGGEEEPPQEPASRDSSVQQPTEQVHQSAASESVTDNEVEYYPGHGSERSRPGDSEIDMSIQPDWDYDIEEAYDSDTDSDEFEGNDYITYMGNEFGFLGGLYDDDEEEEEEFEDPYDYDYEDEEDGDDFDAREEDETIDPAFLFGHLSRTVYARLVQSLPLLEDTTPPPLDHELALELSLRTLPLARGEFPHVRGAAKEVKVLSPTLALAAREMDCGRSGIPPKHATINAATYHRIPSRVQKVMDRMESRAYIGRFIDDGSIFVGKCI